MVPSLRIKGGPLFVPKIWLISNLRKGIAKKGVPRREQIQAAGLFYIWLAVNRLSQDIARAIS